MAGAGDSADVSDLFESGPPRALQERMRLVAPGEPRILRRAVLAIGVGWLPLVVLSLLQHDGPEASSVRAMLEDMGANARSLLAAPLLIVAEAICARRLGRVAAQFRSAGVVPHRELPLLDEAIGSTRRLLGAPAAEIAVIVLAYAAAAALLFSLPVVEFPSWHQSGAGADAVHSAAGWWHMLVSVPLLLMLLFGWLWRLALWTRLLWLVSRLDLELVPAHPDQAAGLAFAGESVRGFSVVALSLAVIVAGRVANDVMRYGAVGWLEIGITAGFLGIIGGLFVAPLLVFNGRLLQERQRGIFEYGHWRSGSARSSSASG